MRKILLLFFGLVGGFVIILSYVFLPGIFITEDMSVMDAVAKYINKWT